jgi:Ser/Thr protein kinase RdoA (MazF antagonist)
MDEIELAGGGINRVIRVGDEVHRPSAPWSPATRELLTVLHQAGLPVPRVLGIDQAGRDVLDYLPGEVAHFPVPAQARSEEALVSVATTLRRFHDASVPLVGRNLPWQLPALPGGEVVVHGDFAPYNLVFSGSTLVGIIDLDYARPGPRTYDIASALYGLAPLTISDEGWGTIPERAARARHFCESYGLDEARTVDALRAVAPRLAGIVSYMREAAAAGHEAFARHLAEGHAEHYETDIAWLTAHLEELGG